VTVTALRHGAISSLDGPVVAVVSGRNIDRARLDALLARHPEH